MRLVSQSVSILQGVWGRPSMSLSMIWRIVTLVTRRDERLAVATEFEGDKGWVESERCNFDGRSDFHTRIRYRISTFRRGADSD